MKKKFLMMIIYFIMGIIFIQQNVIVASQLSIKLKKIDYFKFF